MKETHDFLVPDYYPQFACKMGACRTACCQGWPVSISRQNYFRLLGVDCSPELRRRLDCGLYQPDYPTPEEYARFNPRYDGECPIRMEDGRCALHAELGDGVLPDVCRLYPRGIRRIPACEASCAASCEAVVELFLHRSAPISFIYLPMTLEMPPETERRVRFNTMGRESALRACYIEVMQDRRYSLPDRMLRLGKLLMQTEQILRREDTAELDELLSCPFPEEPALCGTPDGDLQMRLMRGLEIVERMLARLDVRSDNVRRYGEAALAWFGRDVQTPAQYRCARAHFEELFPDWAIIFEHLLVNHMFFAQFPFQDRPESLSEEFASLCAVYALLRFLGLGWMAERQEETDFVDAAAALFRLIEHSSFDRYAGALLRQSGCQSAEALCELLLL